MVIMSFDSKEEASLFHEHPGEVLFVTWSAQVNQLQTAESSNSVFLRYVSCDKLYTVYSLDHHKKVFGKAMHGTMISYNLAIT